jgi:hypothetical protein
MTLEVDVERAQVSGPAPAVRALLDGADAPAAVAEAPLLEAGLAAARDPLARLRVTGLPEPLDGFAGANAAALLLPLGDGRLGLRACTPSGFLGLLVRAVGLRPRPRHAEDAEIVLPAPRMARVLGERNVAAAELDDAAAEALRAHLDALVAHWRIELYGPGAGEGPVGWYLEVVDTERGVWTVRDRPGGAVALVPTDATGVLDELAALPGHVGLGAR